MTLLRLLSWHYARKHLLRSLLTVAGIVIGVAVFVGMHTANQSVLYAFEKTVNRIAGATQLQVQRRDLEPGPQFRELLQSRQAFPGNLGEFGCRRNQQVGVGAAIGSADAPAELVQLRKPIFLSMIYNYSICERDV